MLKMRGSRRGGGRNCSNSLEQLEQRALLSAPYDVFGVGVRYDDGPSLFMVQGAVEADDSITGSTLFAQGDGTTTPGPMDWTRYDRSSYGGLTLQTRAGFTPYASQSGTQFLSDERWVHGGFTGFDADGLVRDSAVMAQVYTGQLPLNNGRLVYTMQMTRLTEMGDLQVFEVVATQSALTPQLFSFTYFLPEGELSDEKTIVSTIDGVSTFDSGEKIVFSSGGLGALFADFDNSDGVVGIASGESSWPFGTGVGGWYRGDITVTGPRTAAFFGVAPEDLNAAGHGVASVVIQFDLFNYSGIGPVENRYTVMDAADWDQGIRTVIHAGVWYSQLSAGPPISEPVTPMTMVASNGDFITLNVPASRSLFPAELRGTDDVVEQLSGVISRPELVAREYTDSAFEWYATTDDNGRPIVYQHNAPFETPEDVGTYSFDLIREAGGEAIVGEPIVFLGSGGGAYAMVAGLSASGDVLLWEQRDGSIWAFRNLTYELAGEGARPIIGSLANATDGISDIYGREDYLAGFDDEGKFVVYHLAFANGLTTWRFVDAERDGLGGHGSIPAGLSPLSGWATGWNAGHFAAIDANGELWAIWTAPDLGEWRVDSLTAASNGPVLTGTPSATITAWGTFHISALDTQGNVIMTWWSPDQWAVQNLTTDFSGPTFEPNSLVSDFNPTLGNINIAGRDANGDAEVYWWSPAGGWQLDTISSGVSMAEIPATNWQLGAAVWSGTNYLRHSQSLIGRDADGDLVRLTWNDFSGPGWVFEDVTAISVPYHA